MGNKSSLEEMNVKFSLKHYIEKRGEIFATKVDEPIGVALERMARHRIMSMPCVMGINEDIYGILDMGDIAQHIMTLAGKNNNEFPTSGWTATVQSVLDSVPRANLLVLPLDASLHDVVAKMLDTRLHRAVIMNGPEIYAFL